MKPTTLESKRSLQKGTPIKRDVMKALKDLLHEQGKSEREIEKEIEEFDKQLGDLKISVQRKKLFEKFPLYTEKP